VTAPYAKLDGDSLISRTCQCSEAIILILFSLCLSSSPDSYMSSSSLPQWHPFTRSSHGCISCRNNGFFHYFNSIPGIGISLGSSLSVGLIFYMMFLSPHGLLLRSSKWSIPANPVFSLTSDEAPSSLSDVLSLEQIRDIVAPTRGFLSRDYSLHLGWNNVCTRQFDSSRTDDSRIDAIYS
jgi:hypothetical protein